jgi:hypothetical protein
MHRRHCGHACDVNPQLNTVIASVTAGNPQQGEAVIRDRADKFRHQL